MEAGFKVFGETSIAVEPSESALDNPAPRQDDKAADGIGTFDDLDPLPASSYSCDVLAG